MSVPPEAAPPPPPPEPPPPAPQGPPPPAPPQQFVKIEQHGHIATVTLARADALNAISSAFAQELTEAFRGVAEREDVWVVVLAAEGEKAFCVGADLKEREGFSLEDFYENRNHIRGLFNALREIPQPTIASVFGFALGGGCELVLSCDLVVAADDAVFGLPEARVGLIPAGGGTQLLARKIGPARAKRYIFTGARFDAPTAEQFGLVAGVVPRAELDTATAQLADEITKASPVAVREAKRAIDEGLSLPIVDALERENEAWRHVIATDDRSEGIKAFNEKRDPEWRNR